MLNYQRVYPILFYLSYLSYVPGLVYIQPIDHSTSQRPLAFCVTPSGLTMAGYPQKRTVAEKSFF
jgi:deoxyxylulose-5-phosphate synthase